MTASRANKTGLPPTQESAFAASGVDPRAAAPILGLACVHVWIYWFNTCSLTNGIERAPWWLNVYGVMTIVCIACALVALRRPSAREHLITPEILCGFTLTATASIILHAFLATSSAIWSGANVILAGISVGLGYMCWAERYADLDIRSALGCLALTYAAGSAVKVAFDSLPGLICGILALGMVAFMYWSLGKFPDAVAVVFPAAAKKPTRAESTRGQVFYTRDTLPSLVGIATCILAICFSRGLFSTLIYPDIPSEAFFTSRLFGHIVEILLACGAFAWVIIAGKALDFSQLWRVAFLFMIAALMSTCVGFYEIAEFSSCILASTIVMLLWLSLNDIAHHSDLHPVTIFGFGWTLYIGSNYASRVLANALPPIEDTAVLSTMILGTLGIVILFGLETRSPDMRRIFSDLQPSMTPEHLATVDEKCTQLAERLELTARELDVLRFLAKGRSNAFIAEELVISENTVRGHVRRLYAKLDVHDRQGLLDLVEADEG